MPDQPKIMDVVQDALNNINFDGANGIGDCTRKILTALCQAGKGLDCQVGARRGKVNEREVTCDYGEWLYDVTWLKYDNRDWIASIPLAAECEFSSYSEKVSEDFQKLLLLSPATLRLMVCRKWPFEDIPQGMPAYLAEHIQHYVDRSPEDAYLLAMWHWDDEQKAFGFKYFQLGPNGATPR